MEYSLADVFKKPKEVPDSKIKIEPTEHVKDENHQDDPKDETNANANDKPNETPSSSPHDGDEDIRIDEFFFSQLTTRIPTSCGTFCTANKKQRTIDDPKVYPCLECIDDACQKWNVPCILMNICFMTPHRICADRSKVNFTYTKRRHRCGACWLNEHMPCTILPPPYWREWRAMVYEYDRCRGPEYAWVRREKMAAFLARVMNTLEATSQEPLPFLKSVVRNGSLL